MPIRHVLIIGLGFLMFSALAQERKIKKRTELTTWSDKREEFVDSAHSLPVEYILYDQQEREIERGVYGLSKGRQTKSRDGTITFACSYDYSKLGTVFFTTYGEMGKKSKEERWHYKNNGKRFLFESRAFDYDETGKLVRETNYSDKGEVHSYNVVAYTTTGLVKSEKRYSANGKISGTTTYVYDSRFNNIEKTDSSFNISPHPLYLTKTVNEFDSSNRLTRSRCFVNNKIIYRYVYDYQNDEDTKMELRYGNESDTSFYCSIETKFESVNSCALNKKTKEVCERRTSGIDTKEIYFYNSDCLLDRIKYSGDGKPADKRIFLYEFY